MISFVFTFLPTAAVLAFVVYMLISRRKYPDRKGGGPFFFDGDNLVLNTGLPYPVPLAEIDRVELKYSPWELEHRMSYGLTVKVFRQSGKTKTVLYKGYGTAKLPYPADMAAALQARGVRRDLLDGCANKKR